MNWTALIIEPDPDEPGCAEVRIDGTIAGRHHRFMLDTGAARTQVTGNFEDARPDDVTSGGIFAAEAPHQLVDVRELRVGAIQITHLEVACVAPSESAVELLGMDVLGRYCCEFSFAGARMLARPAACPQADRPLLRSDRGHALIHVRWGEIEALGCWDTGAGITVVGQHFFQAHPELFHEPSSSIGTDVTNTSVSTPTFTIDGPAIGGHQCAPHRVAVVDLAVPNAHADRPMDMILGYPTLRQADWIMDFPRDRWTLRPAVGAIAKPI
ncbi:MAG TPA: retropepsin-like aspartic protease [Solirubrobacteraceae bacterium]|nr:retropepsin-like aspartic protease [Solirubrobacteraceae bacterium]